MKSTSAAADDGEQIKFPKAGEGHKTITMATIAKAAGVSQGAISSLLNDRDYGIRVSEKTRERVFKVCRELGYIPNDLRAVVRMYPVHGDLCILVSPDAGDIVKHPFYSRILSSVIGSLPAPSRYVTISRFDPGLDYRVREDDLPHPLQTGTASKFLCIGTPNASLFETIIEREFSVVCLCRESAVEGVVSILPDFAEASRLGLEYLFKLGHRRIAILCGPFGATEHSIIELNRGVRMAYEKIGAPIEAQNIIYGDLTFKTGYTSAEILFDRNPAPTAVFCLNDAAAAGVVSLAQKRGLKVPEDVSVLGLSDDAIAEIVQPSLTTVHLPAEEMAAQAVKEAIQRVKVLSPVTPEAKKILLPAQLVERETCAAPKSKA